MQSTPTRYGNRLFVGLLLLALECGDLSPLSKLRSAAADSTPQEQRGLVVEEVATDRLPPKPD